MEQKTVKIQSSEITSRVFGSYDINVRTVEKAFGVKVYNRSDEDGDAVMINGENEENVTMAADSIKYLADMARYNESLSEQQVIYVIDMVRDGKQSELAVLEQVGNYVGLAFQIKDDILDYEGDTSVLGKMVGSDKEKGKSTYVSILGIKGAKRLLELYTEKADLALVNYGKKAEFLKGLSSYLLNREL